MPNLGIDKKRKKPMKIMSRYFIPLIFLVPINAFAFSCMEWKPNFTIMAAELPVVVYARVIGTQIPMTDGERSNAIKIEVISPIKNSRHGEQFLVAGSEFFGGPNMDEFGMGTEWVFALDSLPPGGLKPILTIGSYPLESELKKTDSNIQEARIDLCSTYWLRVENGIVKGSIEGREQNGQMSVEKLIAKLTPKTSALKTYRVKYLKGKSLRDDLIPTPPNNKLIREAINFAKGQEFFTYRVFSRCGDMKSREMNYEAKLDWMDRNDPYQYATMYWIQEMSKEIEKEKGEDAAGEFRAQAHPNMNGILDWLDKKFSDLDENKCRQWIKRLEDTKNDLINSRKYGDVLNQLYLYEVASREQRANRQSKTLNQNGLDQARRQEQLRQ